MTTGTAATEARTSTTSRRSGGRKSRNDSISGYLLIAPAMIYLAVLLLVPFIRGLQLSFTDSRLVNPGGGNFVGMDNYITTLTSSRFWNSLAATFVYTGATVVFAVTLGTICAILINKPFKGRAGVRAIMTFPYAMPTVALSLVFAWMYNQSSGVVNRGLSVLGLGQPGWLTDPDFGMSAVVLATVWKVFPFVMLVVLAALQSIPDELYEATRVDGAGPLSTLRAIVIPHLAPTLRIVTLLMTIWSIRRFEIIYLLTGGGPVESTNTLVINIYRRAFTDQELGLAATIGMLGFVISIMVTVVFFVVDRRETRKEGAS